jgi:hypothetical protein
MYPDFVGIGAQKCGTTPLWESAAWQEWVAASEGDSERRPVQSGPLSSLGVS